MRRTWLAVLAAACLTAGCGSAAGSGPAAAVLAACKPGHHHCPSPSPTPTPTSPSPSPTGTPTPTPSPTVTGTSWACTVTGPGTSCPTGSGGNGNGNYSAYPAVTTSNGWGTYIANNCLDDGACPAQVLQANNYDDWQVTATEPAGNGAVMTGPELQNQTNDWCAADRQWDSTLQFGCSAGTETDTPVSAVSSWTSGYADVMPRNSQTIAEAAYDLWTNYTSDIMVWQDTVGRCNPGSYGQTDLALGVAIGGHVYDVRRYGAAGGEIIFTEEGAGGPGTCAQDSSGTVDLLGVLREVESLGIVQNVSVSLVDFTFEICSTGGGPETFGVTSFTMPTTAA